MEVYLNNGDKANKRVIVATLPLCNEVIKRIREKYGNIEVCIMEHWDNYAVYYHHIDKNEGEKQ